jgi:hypothetical protein
VTSELSSSAGTQPNLHARRSEGTPDDCTAGDYSGTPSGYNNRRCRCEACRAAKAEYARERRRKSPDAVRRHAEYNARWWKEHPGANARYTRAYRARRRERESK